MSQPLSPLEAKLLALQPLSLSIDEAARSLGESPDALRRAAEQLRSAGFISVEREEAKIFEYTPQGAQAQKDGLPEVRLLIQLAGGAKPLASLPADLARVGVGLARRANWIEMTAGSVSLTEEGQKVLNDSGRFTLPSSDSLSSLDQSRLPDLIRRGLVRERTHTSEKLSITNAGKNAAAAPAEKTQSAEPAHHESVSISEQTALAKEIGPINRELMLSGGWKKASLRRYDLSAQPEVRTPARRHPIARVASRIRRIFLSMGFEEMEGPLAESAFFNFDALFQPQDHPARDLADTFYLPGETGRPPTTLSADVRREHEKGWKYSWDEKVARQMVMRTHTTAVSARTLYDTSADKSPRKFFSIGKVFRNEATDYKHLAEFYQVEGIVVWEGATFGHLLGLLKSFYSRLGFEKIRFRPSYFPYTEPSLEIEVFHPARQAWLELGGAGIFRPEVCEPLGGRYPVLAWGLSLERPLMLANKIEDIRTLYRNDLGWLRDFPIK